jgi:hypothetical protein
MMFKKQLTFIRDGNLGVYNRLKKVLFDYSMRTMTKMSDRSPALSGLARKFTDITGDLYLAGMWKNDLARELLWKAMAGERLSSYQAPTWS